MLHAVFSGRTARLFILLFLAGGLVLPAPGSAQPISDTASAQSSADSTTLVDAVTLGVGLATYRGDLNQGLAGTSIGSMLRSGLDLSVGVERSFGPTYLALEGGYSHVRVRDAAWGFSNRILRAELLGGVGIDWGTPHMVRFYTGVGVLNHRPTLDDPAQVASSFDTEALNEQRWSFSVPVGVVINRRVRVALRWVMDDYLDNAGGDTQPYDFMIHVTLNHRIAFN